jgi:hypothetical protein
MSTTETPIEEIQDFIAFAQDHLSHADNLADDSNPGDAILDQISAVLARCALRIQDAQRAILNFGGTDSGTAR